MLGNHSRSRKPFVSLVEAKTKQSAHTYVHVRPNKARRQRHVIGKEPTSSYLLQYGVTNRYKTVGLWVIIILIYYILYKLCVTKSDLHLIKFSVNNIHSYVFKLIYYKKYFVINPMAFIWYHKHGYFFIYNWSNLRY
jgi:hypothetical protein